jgi:hypothetical protein
MGAAYGVCWRKERYIQSFGKETRRREPLRTPMCREDYNIKMDLQEII